MASSGGSGLIRSIAHRLAGDDVGLPDEGRLGSFAGADGVAEDLVAVEPIGLEVAADWRNLLTGETYVGYGQSSGFASDGLSAFDEPHAYALTSLRRIQWALSGTWTVARHAAILNEAGGRIAFRFRARDVNLVMGPPSRGASVAFRLTVDGQPPGDGHGTDVDGDGNGIVNEQRTYQLIRQVDVIQDRPFEIEFLDHGVEAYCFTFG